MIKDRKNKTNCNKMMLLQQLFQKFRQIDCDNNNGNQFKVIFFLDEV